MSKESVSKNERNKTEGKTKERKMGERRHYLKTNN